MSFKNNFNLKTTVKGQKSDATDCFIKIWNSEQSFYIGGHVQAPEDRVHVSKTNKYGTIKGWTGFMLGERGKTVCLSVYDTENMNLKNIFDKFNSFWWMFWYTVSNSNAPSVVHQYHTSTTPILSDFRRKNKLCNGFELYDRRVFGENYLIYKVRLFVRTTSKVIQIRFSLSVD